MGENMQSGRWTGQQRQVIDNRNSNLLVCAAAGSGKTSVLVEHIIGLVTEKEAPCSIDRLLVMTFTDAAASQMRTKICAAIEKALQKDPGDENLKLQMTLVRTAKIQTIHSFCLWLIRENYSDLDIDPDFRIGDAGELALMKEEAAAEVLEEACAAKDADFLVLADIFGGKRDDEKLKRLFMEIAESQADSDPFPFEWFEKAINAAAEPDPAVFVDFFAGHKKGFVGEFKDLAEECAKRAAEDEHFAAYENTFSLDAAAFAALLDTKTGSEFINAVSGFTFSRLGTIRSKEADPQEKERLKSVRDRYKKDFESQIKKPVYGDSGKMSEDVCRMAPALRALLEISRQYYIRFQEKRREKNILDFSDLEHEALKILVENENGMPERQNGEFVFSKTADDLAKSFREILIDEYQDSNQIQETLAAALGAERFGHPDVFTVGDVKQSIYRFRGARPDIFENKSRRYEAQKLPANRLVRLNSNFRSRAEVLEAVNDIFFRIMRQDVGGVCYDDDAALKPGAKWAEGVTADHTPKLLLIDPADEETDTERSEAAEEPDEEAGERHAKELETLLIAGQIKRMMSDGKTLCWDEEKKAYRPPKYSDFAVLLRAPDSWTDYMVPGLLREGIPARAQSKKGYFSAMEVRTVLSVLAVIDNPMQDIPLAAAMLSPFGGFSDRDLAEICGAFKREKNEGLYETARRFEAMAGEAGNEKYRELADRVDSFFSFLKEYREKSAWMPMADFLGALISDTGFLTEVSAMPAGPVRAANLDMLLEKARQYESTSYRGLFNFVRYIEHLREYKTDYGEASVSGGDENLVQVMSIHQSKGLEFPVVFVAGLGGRFNTRDLSADVICDDTLGLAMKYADSVRRVKHATVATEAVKARQRTEFLGEEARILYVAMTRAKEYLILTGSLKDAGKRLESADTEKTELSFADVMKASSFLDWIIPAMGMRRAGVLPAIKTQILNGADLLVKKTGEIVSDAAKEELLKAARPRTEDVEKLKSMLEYTYPHMEETDLRVKLSVSEIKQMGAEDEENRVFHAVGGTGGAERGTAMHRVLSLLDLESEMTEEELDRQLGKLLAANKLSENQVRLADKKAIAAFAKTGLGKRMQAAWQEGRLFRERQFAVGIPAAELGMGTSRELITVQGIIDAYMEEDGGLVLVDYKTDRVRSGRELLDRYGVQLKCYAMALEQILKLPVRESIIYSFALEKEISCGTR